MSMAVSNNVPVQLKPSYIQVTSHIELLTDLLTELLIDLLGVIQSYSELLIYIVYYVDA